MRVSLLLHRPLKEVNKTINCIFNFSWRNFEILGIIIISLGILSLSLQGAKGIKNRSAVIYALVTGFFIMGYSITDGYGARVSNSFLSYMSWSFILNATIFPIILKINNKSEIITKTFKEGKKIFFNWRNTFLYSLWNSDLGFHTRSNRFNYREKLVLFLL